jgi:hypothetical protein
MHMQAMLLQSNSAIACQALSAVLPEMAACSAAG